MRIILRLAPVALAVAMSGFDSLARESCNPKDLTRRIATKTKFPSLIYDCQQDFATAKRCCLSPESCGTQLVRETLSDAGTIHEYKKLKERELQRCERRIKSAKRSCQNDRERLDLLSREFNDILICGDDHLAQLNGKVVKTATEVRYAYQPESQSAPAPALPVDGSANKTAGVPAPEQTSADANSVSHR